MFPTHTLSPLSLSLSFFLSPSLVILSHTHSLLLISHIAQHTVQLWDTTQQNQRGVDYISVRLCTEREREGGVGGHKWGFGLYNRVDGCSYHGGVAEALIPCHNCLQQRTELGNTHTTFPSLWSVLLSLIFFNSFFWTTASSQKLQNPNHNQKPEDHTWDLRRPHTPTQSEEKKRKKEKKKRKGDRVKY